MKTWLSCLFILFSVFLFSTVMFANLFGVIIGSQAFGKACMTFVTQANSYFFHFQRGQRNADFARKRLNFSENSLRPPNPGERCSRFLSRTVVNVSASCNFLLSYTFKKASKVPANRWQLVQTVFLTSFTGAVSGSFDEVNFSPYFLAQFGVRVRRAKSRGQKYNKSVVILCWRPPVAANKT